MKSGVRFTIHGSFDKLNRVEIAKVLEKKRKKRGNSSISIPPFTYNKLKAENDFDS